MGQARSAPDQRRDTQAHPDESREARLEGSRDDARDAGDEERRTDQKVRDVVERIHGEDAEQQAIVGGYEADARGHGEAEQPDEDIDGAEDRSGEAVR